MSKLARRNPLKSRITHSSQHRVPISGGGGGGVSRLSYSLQHSETKCQKQEGLRWGGSISPFKTKDFSSLAKKRTVLPLAGFAQMLLMLHRTFKYQRMSQVFRGHRGIVCALCTASILKEQKARKRKTDRKETKVWVWEQCLWITKNVTWAVDCVRNTFYFLFLIRNSLAL